MTDAVLLDTCAAIWLAQGASMSEDATNSIIAAAMGGGVYVSAVTAWEVGMLHARGTLDLSPSPSGWFNNLMGKPGLRLVDLTPEILIDSSFLPSGAHGDPFDRIVIATARHLGTPVVTRDRKIIGYGASTNAVSVIAA